MSQAKAPRAILSPEETAAASKSLGFDTPEPSGKSPLPPNPEAGSLAPLDSTKGDKWERAISAASLTRLTEIAADIENVMNETVLTVARAKLKIGKLLNEAREVFPGDNEFGKWRKSMVPHLAPRTCSTYMKMAGEFKDAPSLVDAMGWTTARELLNAPEEVKHDVKQKTLEGRPPSQDEVRESKAGKSQGSQAETGTSRPFGAGSDQPSAPAPSTIEPAAKRQRSLDQRIAAALELPVKERIKLVLSGEFESMDDLSQSAIMFGFGPEILDRQPSADSWLAVYDSITAKLEDAPAMVEELNRAYKDIKTHWSTP